MHPYSYILSFITYMTSVLYQPLYLMCILFCSVYRSPWMMRRCINRRQLQAAASCIDYIVPDSCRNKYRIPLHKSLPHIKVIFTFPQHHHCLPMFNSYILVCVLMYFHSNVSISRNTHQGHLQITPGPECCPEIIIKLC